MQLVVINKTVKSHLESAAERPQPETHTWTLIKTPFKPGNDPDIITV